MSFGKKVAIFGGSRTPFVKSQNQYLELSNQDLLNVVISDLVEKNNLKGKILGDVVLGAVMNHPSDWNLSREVVLASELSSKTPGLSIQRACGTSLEAANLIAVKIATGQINSGIAGGSDTNSDVPIVAHKKLSNLLIRFQNAKTTTEKIKIISELKASMLVPQLPTIREPRTGLSMGEHCELMVKEWKISRLEQDQLALESHQNAAMAYEDGFFDDLLSEINGVKKDTIVRNDSSIEKLSKLKTAFDKTEAGTLTAGNSSPLTDGASAVLLGTSEWGEQNGLTPLAYFTDCEVAAVDFVNGEGLLMAPTIAVARLLERNNLKLQDFDFYEIHEAFAGQVLCTLKAWESKEYCQKILGLNDALGPIERANLNVNGGSLAIGHPFAATGGRLIASSAKLLSQVVGRGRILISICTAGGMGVAAIIER